MKLNLLSNLLLRLFQREEDIDDNDRCEYTEFFIIDEDNSYCEDNSYSDESDKNMKL